MTTTVIFDLFGTLVHLVRDTRPYVRLCRAIDDAEALRQSLVVDASDLQTFCDCLGTTTPSDLVDIQHELDADVDSAELYGDSIVVLQKLRDRGLRIGVISNLASPYKHAFHRLGLDQLVDVAVFSCDRGMAKPDGRIYRAALAELGSTAAETIMIGDSRRCDVEGPTACGIRGILLDRQAKVSGPSCISTLTDAQALTSWT